jgi:hypothetical protein
MIRAAVLEPTLSLPEGGSELLPLFVVSGARGAATQTGQCFIWTLVAHFSTSSFAAFAFSLRCSATVVVP